MECRCKKRDRSESTAKIIELRKGSAVNTDCFSKEVLFMLVVTRREGEAITTTGAATFLLLRQKGNCSVIGIIADAEVKILRTELVAQEPAGESTTEDPEE
jgi:sRNA-binding carbon storage regulator CsrA